MPATGVGNGTKLLGAGCGTGGLSALAAGKGAEVSGLKAYRKGDFKGAHREWGALAEKGHGGAQYFLGTLYEKGKGVSSQPVDATHALKLSAGVSNFNVFLGRSFN